MSKKKKTIIIIAVLTFWMLVLILEAATTFISRKKKTSDNLGNIKIHEESNNYIYEDPFISTEGVSLIDTGNVIIYDNEENLAERDFITLKGHIFLPEKLTEYLHINGFENTKSVTVIPES
ncbi:MAG: hypothetical protein K6E51_12870, partial [Treponema sp.]|nr:hypothetical protein [Treponema sp.]